MLSWSQIQSALTARGASEEEWEEERQKYSKLTGAPVELLQRPVDTSGDRGVLPAIGRGLRQGVSSLASGIGAIPGVVARQQEDAENLMRERGFSEEAIERFGKIRAASTLGYSEAARPLQEKAESLAQSVAPTSESETLGEKIISGFAAAPGEFATLPIYTALGGPVGGFALKGAIESYGRGADLPEVAKEAAIGGAMGKAFKALGPWVSKAPVGPKAIPSLHARTRHALGGAGIGAVTSAADQFITEGKVDFEDVVTGGAVLGLLGAMSKGNWEHANRIRQANKGLDEAFAPVAKRYGLEKKWEELKEYENISPLTKEKLMSERLDMVHTAAEKAGLYDHQPRLPAVGTYPRSEGEFAGLRDSPGVQAEAAKLEAQGYGGGAKKGAKPRPAAEEILEAEYAADRNVAPEGTEGVFGAESMSATREIMDRLGQSAVGQRMTSGWDKFREFMGRPPQVISAVDVNQGMSEIWDTPIRSGYQQPGTLGTHHRDGNMTRIKSETDIWTAYHDVAHKAGERDFARVKNNLTPEAKAELVKRSIEKEGRADKGEQYHLDEGWARFLAERMMEGEYPVWGNSTARVMDRFIGEFPQARKALDASYELYRNYMAQDAVAKAQGQIEYPKPRSLFSQKGSLKSKIRQVTDDLQYPIKDMFNTLIGGVNKERARRGEKPFEDEFADPREVATMNNQNVAGQARDFMENGVLSYLSDKRLSPGINKWAETHGIGTNLFKEFGPYFLAKGKLAKPEMYAPHEIGHAKNIVRDVEARRPKWIKAAEELSSGEFGALLKRGVEIGQLTQETVDGWAAEGFYAPAQRYIEKYGLDDPHGAQPFKKRTGGSGQRDKDPFEQIIDTYSAIISDQNRTELLNSIVKLAEEGRDGGRWAWRVPGADPKGPVFGSERPTIRWNAGGERVMYEFDQSLFNAVKGMDPLELPPVVDLLLRKPKAAATMGYTGLNLGFQSFTNPWRDTLIAIFQGGWKDIPALREGVAHHFKSMVPAAKVLFKDAVGMEKGTTPGEVYFQKIWERMKGRGAQMSSPIGTDMYRNRKAMQDKILASDQLSRKLYVTKHPVEFMKDFLGFTEALNRLIAADAAEQLGMKKFGTNNPGDPRVQAHAVTAYADRTVDFRRMSAVSRLLNDSIPFFNATIQGTSKFARSIAPEGKFNPVALIPPMVALTTLKTGIWALYHDEKWYQELPDWERSIFVHVPLGVGEKPPIARLPMPFEWGYVFGYLPEAMLETVRTGEPKEMTDALTRVIEQSLPEYIPVVPKLAHEIASNRNMFQDRPIESAAMQKLEPTERYTPRTREMYKGISKLLSHVGVDLSPPQVEHVTRGMTGGLFHEFAGIPELATEKGRELAAQKIPILSRIMVPDKRPGQSISDFYEMHEKMQQVRNTAKKMVERGNKSGAESLIRKHSDLLGIEDSQVKAFVMAGVPRSAKLTKFAKAQQHLSEMRRSEDYDPDAATNYIRMVLGR